MIKLGLTGGIGSGKTTVAKIFENLGVPVYYSDYWAKELTNSNNKIVLKLKKEFGNEIYSKNKTLNKTLLSKIIFNDKSKLKIANNIIHPIVRNHFDEWVKAQENSDKKYIIKEAAILFESGAYKQVTKTIIVSTELNLRIKRIQKRDNITESEILKKVASQMPEEEKIELSDYIIYNNENDMLLPQVLKFHDKFNK